MPVTWGQGIIEGFSETVRAIAGHLGFSAFVTTGSDVAGLGEAAQGRADVVLLSDDADFQAIHLKAGASVDNSSATGKVFAAGLNSMAGGVAGKKVLVVGCGPVGQQAGAHLLHLGAALCLLDTDQKRASRAAQTLMKLSKHVVDIGYDLNQALLQHRFILDATPAAGIIDAVHLSGDSVVAAPGVPLGLTPRAARKAAGQLLHDTLQLGVAAMLAGVLKQAHAQTIAAIP